MFFALSPRHKILSSRSSILSSDTDADGVDID